MSDRPPPQSQGPNPGRNPWATALLILIGLILLLPGVCSLIFGGIMIDAGGPGIDPGILALLLFCFMVGAGGVALIVYAIRR
ncbi:MAG TPA: hypothetical protein VGN55_02280 [Xanthobacteraceae bacterium]|jgi:hypothetical protein